MKQLSLATALVVLATLVTVQHVAADGEIVVESGNTCWGITEQFTGDGSRFPELYRENRVEIEAEAQARGMESSDFCRWIFPGTVLQIPDSIQSPVEMEEIEEETQEEVVPVESPTSVTSVPPVATVEAVVAAVPEEEAQFPWWAVLIATGLVLAAIWRFRRSRISEMIEVLDEVLQPSRKELLDVSGLRARYGEYTPERRLEHVAEMRRTAEQAVAALQGFGGVATDETRKRIVNAPKEQLREQRLLTAWVLEGSGFLNSDGTVTLYRGFRDESKAREVVDGGRVTRVSSFTLKRSTAVSFNGGGVIVARVPIELIAGSFLSCVYPFQHEQEVTVLSGRIASAVYYTASTVPSVRSSEIVGVAS